MDVLFIIVKLIRIFYNIFIDYILIVLCVFIDLYTIVYIWIFIVLFDI